MNDKEQERGMMILPRYCFKLHEASHLLYIALEMANGIPGTPKEDFEEMIKIYEELGELVEKIENRETQR
jgi:hypothetical protein